MSATAFQRMRREQAAREDYEQEVIAKPLEKMTLAELKEHASLKSIDLGEATKKDDILAAIKAAEGKTAAAEVEATKLAAETELQELREKDVGLGIEDVDGKDADTLKAQIAEKGGGSDGDH